MANLIAIPCLSSGEPSSGFRPQNGKAPGDGGDSFADWLSKASSAPSAGPDRPQADSPGNDSGHDSSPDNPPDDLDDETAFSGIPSMFAVEPVCDDPVDSEPAFDGFAAPDPSVPSPISAVGANAGTPQNPIPSTPLTPAEPAQAIAPATSDSAETSALPTPPPAPADVDPDAVPADGDSFSPSSQAGSPPPAGVHESATPDRLSLQDAAPQTAAASENDPAETGIFDDEEMAADSPDAPEILPPTLAPPVDSSPRESIRPETESRHESSHAPATTGPGTSSGSTTPIQAPESSGPSDGQKQSFQDAADSMPEPRAEIAFPGATAASSPATASSAATPAAAPAETPVPSSMNPATLAENLDRIVLNSIRADQNGIRIELEPLSLGRVMLRARETSEGLSVDISVQNGEIRSLLAGQEQDLRLSLESQGIQLGRFSVSCRDGDGGRPDSNQSGHEREQASAEPDDRRAAKSRDNPDGLDGKRLARPGTRNRWVA